MFDTSSESENSFVILNNKDESQQTPSDYEVSDFGDEESPSDQCEQRIVHGIGERGANSSGRDPSLRREHGARGGSSSRRSPQPSTSSGICRGRSTTRRLFAESARNDMGQHHIQDYFGNSSHVHRNVYREEKPTVEAVIYEDNRIVEDRSKDHSPSKRQKNIYKAYVDGFRKSHPRRKILHDILFDNVSPTRSRDISSVCRRSNYKGAVIIVAAHRDHYHLIHDCAYTGSTCRCTAFQTIRRGRRLSRRSIWSWEFSIRHWVNITVYFQQQEREIIHAQIAGRNWHDCCQAGDISAEFNCRDGQVAMVEGGSNEINICNFVDCRSEAHDGTETPKSSCPRYSRHPGSRQDRKSDRLYKWLLKFSTAPLNKVFSTHEFINSEYKFMNTSSREVKRVMDLIQFKYTNSSMEELIELYESCEKVYFQAPINFEEYYYDTAKSIEIMENILFFQNNNNFNISVKFLRDVHAICEKKIPKKNALFILSPPNAGKNLFFDAIIHWYSNYGQIANFNKHQQFPLMDAINRRICVWNEPACESSSFETLKLLFGGDSQKVKVKYEGDAVVDRTPIIILSNIDCFPKDTAFLSRMIKYEWQPYAELRHVKKKINPNAYIHLLIKYKIVNEKGLELSLLEDNDIPSDYACSDNESEM